jgi:hypothetical protein
VDHDRGRDHVVGQTSGEGLQDGVRGRGRARCEDGVGDEALVPRLVLAQEDRGALDARLLGEGGFDLAWFDAEAAQLDLCVRAAHVGEGAVRPPLHQVARAVHALAAGRERTGHEPLRRDGGARRVSAGQLGSCNVEFADHTHRHRAQAAVQDEGAGPALRAPDRHPGRRQCLARAYAVFGDVHGRLGRPVGVDDEGLRVASAPLRHVRAGQGLAAQDQFARR